MSLQTVWQKLFIWCVQSISTLKGPNLSLTKLWTVNQSVYFSSIISDGHVLYNNVAWIHRLLLRSNTTFCLAVSPHGQCVNSAVCIISISRYTFSWHSFPCCYHIGLSDESALASSQLEHWRIDRGVYTEEVVELASAFFNIHCDSFGLFLSLLSAVCVAEPLSGGPLCDCPLPNPEMSFHLWTADLDICECLLMLAGL